MCLCMSKCRLVYWQLVISVLSHFCIYLIFFMFALQLSSLFSIVLTLEDLLGRCLLLLFCCQTLSHCQLLLLSLSLILLALLILLVSSLFQKTTNQINCLRWWCWFKRSCCFLQTAIDFIFSFQVKLLVFRMYSMRSSLLFHRLSIFFSRIIFLIISKTNESLETH